MFVLRPPSVIKVVIYLDTQLFKALYQVCFDEQDNIRPCGREACKKLIRFLGGQPYGDPDTGMMHTDTIKALYHDVFDEQKR